jgi:hypothetical protein
VIIHHEGTKGTKASSAVQNASHAVPEQFDIEIYEEPHFMIRELEIGEKLSTVNSGELFAGFEFNDYQAFDEEIYSDPCTEFGSLVGHRDGYLALDPKTSEPQLTA